MEIDPSTVKKAIEWGAKNDTSFIPSADFSVRRKLANNKTAKIGADVVRLRNQGLTFEEIAEELGTTGGTASRAYKQYHTKANLAAVEKGERLDTGKNKRKISPDQVNLMRVMLADKSHSQRAIAEAVGVSPSTVRDEIKRMTTSM
ncbi:winged helix-turn-helix transcriptional regulator [Rhodopirellula baltica]